MTDTNYPLTAATLSPDARALLLELMNFQGSLVSGDYLARRASAVLHSQAAPAPDGMLSAWHRAIYYTDTIGGKQTGRDDLWAITSAELRDLEARADAASRVVVRTAAIAAPPDALAALGSISEWMRNLPIPTRGCGSNMERLRRVIDALVGRETSPTAPSMGGPS